MVVVGFYRIFCTDTSEHAADVRSRISELCLELRRFTPYPRVWSCSSSRWSRFPRSSHKFWWWPHRYTLSFMA